MAKNIQQVTDFAHYFINQWVNSPTNNWTECSSWPYVATNNGLEATNRMIKDSHSFRRKMPLNQFNDMVETMIYNWSKKPEYQVK